MFVKNLIRVAVGLGISLAATSAAVAAEEGQPVGPGNFVRAETDNYFSRFAAAGAFGTLQHRRVPVQLDRQSVIRMNIDTLYSSGVFDLAAGPVTLILPPAEDGRYVSAQVVSHDHHTVGVYQPGTHTISLEDVGTRYAAIIVRVFVDATDDADLALANAWQDRVEVRQADKGSFQPGNYDSDDLNRTRKALLGLVPLDRTGLGQGMGRTDEVDPVAHLMSTAAGWGLLPPAEATYYFGAPEPDESAKVHQLVLDDVPAQAFWSVTLYNADGYMEPNALGIHALNTVTATPADDGRFRIRFGGCESDATNCLPTSEGWNYVLRLYRPEANVLDGSWTPPRVQVIE